MLPFYRLPSASWLIKRLICSFYTDLMRSLVNAAVIYRGHAL